MINGILFCHLGAGIINDREKFIHLLDQTNESLAKQNEKKCLEPLEIVEHCMEQLEVKN